MEEQPGSRGTMKVCSRKFDFVNMCLLRRNLDVKISSVWKCPSAVIRAARSIPPAACTPRKASSVWRIPSTAFMIRKNKSRTFLDICRLCGIQIRKRSAKEPSCQEPEPVHGNLFRGSGIQGGLEIRYHGMDKRCGLRNLDMPRRFRKQKRQTESRRMAWTALPSTECS